MELFRIVHTCSSLNIIKFLILSAKYCKINVFGQKGLKKGILGEKKACLKRNVV